MNHHHPEHMSGSHGGKSTAPQAFLNRTAWSATLHCLTGCAIGEVLGMIIGTALGWGNGATVTLSVVLAFFFGYLLTLRPLLGQTKFANAARLAFASDTASITVMEIVDNALMLVIPGAMDAGLTTVLFWASLAASLAVAAVVAFPVNRCRRALGANLDTSAQEPAMQLRFLAVTACLIVANTAANAAVTLNGAALPQADARPDVTVAITEVRESSDTVIRLAPGIKRYGVSVVSKFPIAALEAELPLSSTSARFNVGAGGRTFRNCAVASLSSDPQDSERLVYALRCEGVTIP